MLRRSLLAALIMAPSAGAIAQDRVFQPGYTRRDGTYVQPHWRTAPDGNPHNNWSTRGNVNPYTGERGSVDPFRAPHGQSFFPPPDPTGDPFRRRR